jgi:dihydroxyacetone kinase-like protein
MKRVLTNDDVVAALQAIGDALTAQAEALRELDAAIGDGDLGITVTLGFQAVRETLPSLATSDISTILMRSGMAFNRKAASTFGALFATMLMRAAKEAKCLDQIDTPALARMVVAAAEGVMERGKAELGDKTLLDALVPAGVALTAAADKGASLGEALALATTAAENGMLATADMKSKMGRSSWFAERTVGIQDPGATAVTMMFRALAEFVAR